MTTQQPEALSLTEIARYCFRSEGLSDPPEQFESPTGDMVDYFDHVDIEKALLARITELESQLAQRFDAADSVPAVEREQERIAFKDAHRHLELDEVPDAWGRPTPSPQAAQQAPRDAERELEMTQQFNAGRQYEAGRIAARVAAAPAGSTEMENLQRTAVGWQERALRAERNWVVCRRWAIAGGAPVEKLGDDPDQPFHAASPTAQSADSVPAVSDLPPLPAPDLRDVGTKPQEIKEFLKGYATEYARTAIAALAPADSVQEDAARWHWMAEYIVGTRTDLDDGIIASATVDELRKLVDADLAARKQGATQ